MVEIISQDCHYLLFENRKQRDHLYNWIINQWNFGKLVACNEKNSVTFNSDLGHRIHLITRKSGLDSAITKLPDPGTAAADCAD